MTDYEIRTNIQNKILELRLNADMTQTEFGYLFDKKKTTVATWEQGKTLPDPATLYRIAKYFKVSMNYLYGEENEN